jgi:hypothetical protein
MVKKFLGFMEHEYSLACIKKFCPMVATSALIVILSRGRKLKVLFYPMLPDFRKTIAFRKVPRLRPFALLVRATYTRR